jgi:hypothetical protein
VLGPDGVTDVNGLRKKGEKERGSRSSLVEGLAETSELLSSGASGRP